MSNSPSPSNDQLWVRLVGPLLDKDDPFWSENNSAILPRSAPHERAVVDHLYELERCGASIFVYDPIIAAGGDMTRAAQDYLYGHALNAWAVAEEAPPPGVEVLDTWPQKTTSTPDSTQVESPTTTSAPSSASSGSSS